jgi:hypothetical protein
MLKKSLFAGLLLVILVAVLPVRYTNTLLYFPCNAPPGGACDTPNLALLPTPTTSTASLFWVMVEKGNNPGSNKYTINDVDVVRNIWGSVIVSCGLFLLYVKRHKET